MLYSIMIDVDDLLPWFVQKKIITLNSPVEIWVKIAVREKVEKLLQYVSGTLDGGDVKGFFTLLNIMEVHGTQATKELSITMRSHLRLGEHYLY